MKRKKQPYPYPACIGFYKRCKTCDGDVTVDGPKGAPCASRDGCRLLLQSIGGPGFRDRAAIAEARERYPADILARNLATEFEEKDSQKVPRRKRTVNPRPQRGESYFNALVIAEAIAERAVEESGLTLVDETKSYKRATDAFVRMRPSGKAAALYQVQKTKKRNLLIAEFNLYASEDAVTMQVNCGDYVSAFDHGPPPGVPCRLWSRGERALPRVTLVGIEPATARSSGSWLARLIADDLIGAVAP